MIPKEIQDLGEIIGSQRGDCPFCGNKNTFSISNTGGSLVWNCFHARCSAHGSSSTTRSVSAIRSTLGARDNATVDFVIPDHWVTVLSSENAVRYLRRNHCYIPYARRAVDLRFDPSLARVVFICKEGNYVTGAVGRALDNDAKPKWHRYDANHSLFVAGIWDLAIVVEDAASACAVSHCATGIALLGTSMNTEQLARMRTYKHVIVALDPDATSKAVELQKRISFFTKSSVMQLPDDFKYFEPELVKSRVEEHMEGRR